MFSSRTNASELSNELRENSPELTKIPGRRTNEIILIGVSRPYSKKTTLTSLPPPPAIFINRHDDGPLFSSSVTRLRPRHFVTLHMHADMYFKASRYQPLDVQSPLSPLWIPAPATTPHNPQIHSSLAGEERKKRKEKNERKKGRRRGYDGQGVEGLQRTMNHRGHTHTHTRIYV